MYEIRPVKEADLPELVRLCAEHAEYEHASYDSKNKAEGLKKMLFGVDPRLFGWVVADKGGRLVGYATVTIDFSTWNAAPYLHMDCLYLEESHRHKGIGRKLMDVLDDFAIKKNCGHLEWQTPPDNKLGIAFYERIGASSKDKKRFFLTATEKACQKKMEGAEGNPNHFFSSAPAPQAESKRIEQDLIGPVKLRSAL